MEQKVKFLSEIEHIQLRPSMYIGSTDTPKHLIKEIIDNSCDEFLNNYATRVDIEMNDGEYIISDNGRGLPLYTVPDLENQVAAKLLCTKLFSGGKFVAGNNYTWSSGLHGVGMCCVAALSSMTVIVNTHKKYFLHIENGEVKEEYFDKKDKTLWWSTRVICKPSAEYFKTTKTQIDTLPLSIAKGIKNAGSITINGEEVKSFNFQSVFETQLLEEKVFASRLELGTVACDIQWGWSREDFNCQTRGTVNLVSSTGWHERKILSSLGRAIYETLDKSITPEDAQYGLRVFINLFTQKPNFTSQTKERLSHIGDEPEDFQRKLTDAFAKELRSNRDYLTLLQRRIIEYKKQLEKLTDNEFITSVVRTGDDKRKSRGIGVGIWDCTTTNRQDAELYIVEGQSASGHIRTTRNQKTQAVLPLRGKVMNAVAANDIKNILENKELLALVNAIGAGVSPLINISAIRYGKILIAADADIDGRQITNLILGALVYLVPDVVYAGHVYEVLSPLYEQNGKYFYNLDDVNTSKSFNRFKGLGSMNANEVEYTIVNPKTRCIRQVVLDDRDRVLHIMQSAFEKKRIMIEAGIVIE
jgi:DNA gyrase subunit B